MERGARWLGSRLLGLVTSRFVVVVSTTCAILYAGVWLVGLLQVNGLVSTFLPFAVSDSVILQRSGASLRPASVGASELTQRQQALAGAKTAPGGGVAAPSKAPMTLEIQASAPVNLWVMNNQHQAIGVNPQTGLVRLEIPGAKYSGAGRDPQIVSIPHASGVYQVQLIGTGAGQFELRVRAFRGSDVRNATEYVGKGEVFPDTVLQTQAVISAKKDGSPNLQVAAVHVLLAGASPSASSSASPQPSASSSASPYGSPSSLVAGATARPPSPPAAITEASVVGNSPSSSPPTVYRPHPLPRLPLPLPLPSFPTAPAVQHQG